MGASVAASAPMPAQAMHPIIPVPASVRSRPGTLTLAGEVSLAAPAGRDDFQSVAGLFARSARPLTGLTFRVTGSSRGRIVLTAAEVGPPEAYELSVRADGIEIRASHPSGVLLPLHASTVELRCLEIRDQPRFSWRGVLLDSARHFSPRRRCARSSMHWRATS